MTVHVCLLSAAVCLQNGQTIDSSCATFVYQLAFSFCVSVSFFIGIITEGV